MDIGDDTILHVELRSRAGVLTDAVSISGWIKDPDDIVQSIVFAHTGTGMYEKIYAPLKTGVYWWRFESYGPNGIRAAGERSFEVEPQRVTH